MDASREIKLRMKYTTDDVAETTTHCTCARCGGDGVNRTTRHLNQNGQDAASDFNFVPCWVCRGSGWTMPLAQMTEQACREALRLEEELASGYPQHFKPRPPKKAAVINVIGEPKPAAILKARFL